MSFSNSKGDIIKKIWIILEGKKVESGRIEVLKLADILSNLQRFITDYGRAKGVKRLEYLKLYLSEVKKGSIRIALEPPRVLHEPFPLKALNAIKNIAESLDNIDEVKTYLETEFKANIEEIIKELKRLKAIWSEDSITVKLGVGHNRPDEIFVLDPKKREKVDGLIREYIKLVSQTVKGAIVEWKFYGQKRHFEIITTGGERIRCYYNHLEFPELEDVIYEHIKRMPVEVVGHLKKVGRKKIMEDVLEIRSWTEEELTGIFAGYKLKKPIKLNVEYDNFDNVWCLCNEELNLFGCGQNLEEAKKDLEVVFEALIEEYAKESDDILSEKSLELKKKLLEYVEVS